MHDHNLDDLIIDTNEPHKKSKLKSFFTFLGIAVILLVVTIFITKNSLQEAPGDDLLFEQDTTEPVNPNLTLKNDDTEAETLSIPQPHPAVLAETPPETEVEEVVEKVPDVEIQELEVQQNAIVELTVTSLDPFSETESLSEDTIILDTDTETVKEKTPLPETAVQRTKETPTKTETKPEPIPVIKPRVEPLPEAAPMPNIAEKSSGSSTKKLPQQLIDKSVQRPNSRPLNVLTRPDEYPVVNKPQSGAYYLQ
ncbi:MAG TPA: hypothetical protein ENK72_00600, partial [Epsilonproteobacteria bacterium]|nr:hypothetical protein [Campylobacterota bacterium]